MTAPRLMTSAAQRIGMVDMTSPDAPRDLLRIAAVMLTEAGIALEIAHQRTAAAECTRGAEALRGIADRLRTERAA